MSNLVYVDIYAPYATLAVSRTYADRVAKISRVADYGQHILKVLFTILLSFLFFPPFLQKIKAPREEKKYKLPPCQIFPPPPRLPDAPPASVTNSKVALTLLPPPSSASPASPRHVGAANIFQDCSEKQASDIALTGYSPAKKKGVGRLRGTLVSPRDAYLIAKDFPSGKDNENYVPTLIIREPLPKKKGGGGDAKVILDSNFFTYLCPRTFDKDLFICGHPTIYSEKEMIQFDANAAI